MASRKRTYTAAEASAVFLESEEDELSDLEEFADPDDDGVLGTDDEGSSEDENSGDSDQTEEYEVRQEFRWANRASVEPTRLAFTGDAGMKVDIPPTKSPMDYFKLFFTMEILGVILLETNRRAAQLQQAALPPHSRLNNWVDVDVDELLVYFALLIYQGIVHKAELKMYWTTKALYETPYIRQIMSYGRFLLLQRCLHFVDNTSVPFTENKVKRSWQKIKPFFDSLVCRFSTVYIPQQHIAIDESLMLWKGRLAMKQYIPMKRSRIGLKSYELCESVSGYIWHSIVHTGTEMQLDDSADGLVSSKIVLTLARNLLGKGYCIYMDNWYSSPTLYRQLRENNTDAVGTVRLNTKNMPADLKKKLQKGQTIARFSPNLLALKWRDKREVSMLSSCHDASMTTVSSRTGDMQKPTVVVDYNRHMGGVDAADQMLVTYPTERKRRKVWYKKEFCHLLNQAVLNSYILYRKDTTNRRMTHLQFRQTLLENILEAHHKLGNIPQRGRPSLDPSNPLRLTMRHFCRYIPPTEGKEAPTRRCKVCCSHKGRDGKPVRKETRTWCEDCAVPLCQIPCFELYHTRTNY